MDLRDYRRDPRVSFKLAKPFDSEVLKPAADVGGFYMVIRFESVIRC